MKFEVVVVEEMGMWGKVVKCGGEVKIYNFVLLRDKVMGEMFMEEELVKKKERVEREKFEMEFEVKERVKERRRDERDGGEKEWDCERRDRDRRRECERWDDRGERDRDWDCECCRYDDSDEEYYCCKEKERR